MPDVLSRSHSSSIGSTCMMEESMTILAWNRSSIVALNGRIPSDHIPIRSWPLFLARELMRDLIETLKAEQST